MPAAKGKSGQRPNTRLLRWLRAGVPSDIALAALGLDESAMDARYERAAAEGQANTIEDISKAAEKDWRAAAWIVKWTEDRARGDSESEDGPESSAIDRQEQDELQARREAREG